MKVARSRLALGILGLFLAAGFTAAHAAFVSYSRVAFDSAFPGAVVENWDGFPTGTIFPNGSTINGITYTTTPGSALVTSDFLASTFPNTLGETPTGFFDPSDTITFTFSNLLAAFGIDISTAAMTDGAYTATTNGGDVIPSVFDPFPDTGQFVGFSTDTAFNSVTIGATTAVFGYTVDTLREVAAAREAPEPATFALLGAAVAAMGLVGRAKRRARVRRQLSGGAVFPRSCCFPRSR